jgi:hypothetical protein
MLDYSVLSMENGSIGDSTLSVSYLMIHSASLTLKNPQIVQSAVDSVRSASYPYPLIAKAASTYPGKYSALLALSQPTEGKALQLPCRFGVDPHDSEVP